MGSRAYPSPLPRNGRAGMTTPRPRPSMARFQELYTLYLARGEPDAKSAALRDAQYEADERASMVSPPPVDFIGVGSI